MKIAARQSAGGAKYDSPVRECWVMWINPGRIGAIFDQKS